MAPTRTPLANGRRYFVWLAFGFLGGILYALIHPIPLRYLSLFLLYSLLFLFLASVLLVSLRLLFPKAAPPLADTLLLWFFLLAFFLGILRTASFGTLQYRTLSGNIGVSRQYIGVLTEPPFESNSGKSKGFAVKVLSVCEEDGSRTPCKGNLLLYVPSDASEHLSVFSVIRFTANLSLPKEAPYPGGYSLRRQLYSQGLFFMEYTKHIELCDEVYAPTPWERLTKLGQTLQAYALGAIDQCCSATTAESALLKGLLLGVKQDFSAEQYQQFTDSGLVHIISVSGMHILFLCSFLLFFLRRLRVPKWLIFLILCPILLLFAAISAFTPSVCRATIMMLFLLFSQALRREGDSLTSLSIAAVLLTAINPYAITDYGFLLSFGSTLGILVFAAPISRLFLRPFSKTSETSSGTIGRFCKNLLRGHILPSLALSLSANLGVGYFMARFFQRLLWGSLLANLLLLPLASSSFLLGLFTLFLSFFTPACARLVARFPLQLLLWLINRLAAFFSHPIFRIVTKTPPASAILPYLVFCLALFLVLRPLQEEDDLEK